MKLPAKLATICLLLTALIAPWPRAGLATIIKAAPRVGQVLARADAAYQERGNLARARAALAGYRRALKLAPWRDDIKDRLFRALLWVGEREPDKEKRVALFKEGLALAKKAVRQKGKSAAAYCIRGVFGALVLQETNNVFMVSRVKADLAEAIKLNASYEAGAPHRVLGRLYHKLPWFLGGSNKKALNHLIAAVKAGPRTLNNHLFLAELYLSMGKRHAASDLLHQVIKTPPVPGQEPEFAAWKARARRMLTRL